MRPLRRVQRGGVSHRRSALTDGPTQRRVRASRIIRRSISGLRVRFLLALLVTLTSASCGSSESGTSQESDGESLGVAPTVTDTVSGFVAGADGHRIFYRIVGSGEDTVLVVHGFQGNSQAYLAPDVARVLSGFTLIFYDQRGGGRSDPVATGNAPGFREHVADLEALRSELELGDLRILAHSGGAYIAVQYALDHPGHVDRLLLVSPGPPHPRFSQEIGADFYARLDSATWGEVGALDASLATADDPRALCEQISAILLSGAYLARAESLERMEGSMCDAPNEALRSEAARRRAFQESVDGRDWTVDLRRVTRPVLILHGDRDAIPLAVAEAWSGNLPAGRLVVVEGADHLPWLDRPGVVADSSAAFLGRPERRGP